MHVAAQKVRPPLHPLERTFLGLVCVHLVFLPWAFGTMHVWSQFTALAFGVLGLGVALLPRRYEPDQHSLTARSQEPGARSQVMILHPLPRLLKFPLFWLGLLLLVLVVVQALNPWWVWERNATSWWLRRVTDIPWLPTSIDAPFERSNASRQLLIYGSAWLTVCALWIGITRRRSLQILLGVLVGNGLLLAVAGFVQRMTDPRKVLWIREFPGADSFGSFVYRNHAGAYLGLAAAAALGLAVWHFFEGRRKMSRSTPSALWFVALVVLVFAVLFSFSRGAVITLAVFLVGAVAAFFIVRAARPVPSTTPRLVTAMVVLVVVGTVGWVVRRVDFTEITRRMETLSRIERDESYIGRKLARESAWAMLGDHWVRGVGAGGFRHLFPEYIKDKPAIYARGALFWEHAHCDWLEIPIELGAAGSLLLLAGAGYLLSGFWKLRGWRHPVGVMLLIGCGQTMLHATIEFPFHCPAILTTWCAMTVIALRWLELDGRER